MNLVRARGWGNVKPPPGSQIDFGHPLAQGLMICIPALESAGAAQNIIGGKMLVPSATPPLWGGTQRGIGMRQVSGAYYTIGTEGTDFTLPSDSVTVFMAKWRSVGNLAAHGWGAATIPPGTAGADANARRLGGHVPFSDGVVYWDFGGQDATHRLSVSGLAFGDDTWAFTAGRRGQTIWQNGALRASQSTAITRNAAGGSFDLNRGQTVTSSETETRYSFFYLWNRELNGSEIEWLHAEPYAFFQPPGPRILYIGFDAPTATPVTTTTPGVLHLGRRRAVTPRSTAIRVPVGVDS